MNKQEVISIISQSSNSPQKVKNLGWKTFSKKDWDEIRKYANFLEDNNQKINSLSYLFRISQDNWFSIRVLMDIYNTTGLSINNKKSILSKYRIILDRIWRNIIDNRNVSPTLQEIFSYEAIYHSNNAELIENQYDFVAALRDYCVSLAYYLKSGNLSKVNEIEEKKR